MITVEQFSTFAPDAIADPPTWVTALQTTFSRYWINTPLRTVHFMAQAFHESAGFQHLEENLHYSAQRLREVWPNRFPNYSLASNYANSPQRIANRVYADRMGNGDEMSGDGWKFRGRGIFQLTGRSNYAVEGAETGLDLVGDPDLLLQPLYAAMTAGSYWSRHDCNELADHNDLLNITRKINGGLNGLQDRERAFSIAKEIFL